MNTRRTLTAVVPLLLLASLAACQTDEGATSATSDSTTSVAAGGGGGGIDGNGASLSDHPSADGVLIPVPAGATPDPTGGTSPDDSAAPATAPLPPPPTTAPPAGTDMTTGLLNGPIEPAPDGITTDDSIKGTAMITIDGPFQLSLSGGLCSFVDSTLFIQAGNQADGDFISLSYNTVDRSLASITDTATITGELLQWESEDKTAMSLADGIDIIFDGAAISGSFSGVAAIAGPSTPTGKIDFGGRFSCTPAPFEIRGAESLHLGAARCYSADSYVSAGGATGDAALLAFDPSSLSAGDTMTNASLTYRVGTAVFTSVWAVAEVDPDGLGATFKALMKAADGSQFEVTGGFSCL